MCASGSLLRVGSCGLAWRGPGAGAQVRRGAGVLACTRVGSPSLRPARRARAPCMVHARVAPLASTPSPTTHSRVPPVSRGWRAWRSTAHTSMRTCLACTVECSGCPGAGLGLRGSTSGDQTSTVVTKGMVPLGVPYAGEVRIAGRRAAHSYAPGSYPRSVGQVAYGYGLPNPPSLDDAAGDRRGARHPD